MKSELISKVMREMGRKGGKAAGGKGGKKRMAALTPEQRKDLQGKQHKGAGPNPKGNSNPLPNELAEMSQLQGRESDCQQSV
jgi:hypothetical protein